MMIVTACLELISSLAKGLRSTSEGTYGLMIFTATLDLSGLSAC